MAFQGDSIFWVEVEKIVPNPYQPRREFDEGKLGELAESIRMYGVLQPLTVTRKEIQRDDEQEKGLQGQKDPTQRDIDIYMIVTRIDQQTDAGIDQQPGWDNKPGPDGEYTHSLLGTMKILDCGSA